MEEETYYLMTHPTYLEDESTLRYPLCWDESIKNKYEQQKQQFLVKGEGDSSLTSDYEQQQQRIVIKLGMFDVSVSLVDCLRKRKSVTPNLAELVTQSKSACNIPETSTERSLPKDVQDKQLQSNIRKYVCSYCDHRIFNKIIIKVI